MKIISQLPENRTGVKSWIVDDATELGGQWYWARISIRLDVWLDNVLCLHKCASNAEHTDTLLHTDTDICKCALRCEKKCANNELCKSGECAEDTANDAFFCPVVLPHLGKKLALGRQKAEGRSKERRTRRRTRDSHIIQRGKEGGVQQRLA